MKREIIGIDETRQAGWGLCIPDRPERAIQFGGNAGRRPRIGDVVARDLATEEAIDCVQRLAEYSRIHANPRERTVRFMERTGTETLGSGLLSLPPYLPLEKVNRI